MKMEAVSYGVVKEMNLEALIRSVNENIKLGIQPIGGLVINTTYHGVEYLQAMVKVETVKLTVNGKKMGRPFGTVKKGVVDATAS